MEKKNKNKALMLILFMLVIMLLIIALFWGKSDIMRRKTITPSNNEQSTKEYRIQDEEIELTPKEERKVKSVTVTISPEILNELNKGKSENERMIIQYQLTDLDSEIGVIEQGWIDYKGPFEVTRNARVNTRLVIKQKSKNTTYLIYVGPVTSKDITGLGNPGTDVVIPIVEPDNNTQTNEKNIKKEIKEEVKEIIDNTGDSGTESDKNDEKGEKQEEPTEGQTENPSNPEEESIEYIVTFDYNGATSGNEETSKTVEYNKSYGVLPNPAKDDAIFIGWFYNEEKIEETTIVRKKENHTLVAKWGVNDYLLTYDFGTNGGQVSITDTRTILVEDKNYNDDIDLTKAAFKSNSIFLGWAETSYATTALSTTAELKMPEEDKTIYAIFADMNVTENNIEIDLADTEDLTKTTTIEGTNYGVVSVVSDNTNVAIASVSGNTIAITGVNAGTAKITVTSSATDINGEAIEKEITVSVIKTPRQITISEDNILLNTNQGSNTATLEATITPTGTTLGNTIQWTSSDNNVATIDESGNITAVGDGETTITARTGKNNDITATVTVVVDGISPVITITRNSYDTCTWNISDERNLVAYQITQTAEEPTTGWVEVAQNQKEDTLTITDAETNYIWAKDKSGNITVEPVTSYQITKTAAENTTISIITDATDDENKHVMNDFILNVLEGTPVTISASANAGYTAILKNNGTTIESGAVVVINSATIISTTATPNTYNIAYELASGTAGENTPETAQFGTTVTVPQPTKTGYQFAGWTGEGLTAEAENNDIAWNGTQTNTGTNTFKNLTNENNGTVTLTANWTAETYTVSLDANEGTVLPASVQATYGNTYGELPTPEKTGSTFMGWFYNDEKIEASTVVSVAGNHTLVARWGMKEYVLTYDFGTNGGQVSETDTRTSLVEDKNYNENIDLTKNAYKANNAFLGWAETNNATTALATTAVLKMPNSNKTIYAIFANMNVTEDNIEIDLSNTDNLTKTTTVEGTNYGTASVVSSNENIATASISGNTITITGAGTGNTSITVTSSATDINGEAMEKVINVSVIKTPKQIALSEDAIVLGTNPENNTITLETTITPAGTTIYNDVQWSSSDESIVTVDQSGNVTAVAEGTATITAATGKNNEITATATVIVDVTEPTVTITRTNYNTFTWNISDETNLEAYQITKTSETPTAGWIEITGNSKTDTLSVNEVETNYVWAKDKAGNISNASIASYLLSNNVAENTTLVMITDADDDTNKYNVTSNSIIILEETPVTVTATSNYGYTVTLKNNDTEITSGTVVVINGATTISTTATANTYNIAYELAGGTAGENTPTTVQFGTVVTVPQPTKTGYQFAGWTGEGLTAEAENNDIAWGGTQTNNGINTFKNLTNENNGTVKLTANWTAETYTVTLNPNEGSVLPTSIEVTYGSSYGELPTPTKTGTTFLGWYYNSSKIENSTIVKVAENHTLVARWSVNDYVLTYDFGTNGGQVSETDTRTSLAEDKNYNENIDLTKNAYKANNVFLGWAETSDATAALATTAELKMPSSNKTLYAIFANMNLSENAIEIDLSNTENLTKAVTVEGTNYGTASVVSSNENIATASISGNTITITGAGTGNTSITVTSSATDINGEAMEKVINVSVIKTPKQIALSEDAIVLGTNPENNTITLETTITPAGTTIYNDVQWSSSDESIVTVDQSGNVTAVAEGTATITAATGKNNEITATATVIVDVTEPTVTITRTNYNTFTWNISDETNLEAYQITKTSETPTAGWIEITGNSKTDNVTITDAETNYVWAKDKAGNISVASISSYLLTKNVGENTTLSIVSDATDEANKYTMTGSTVNMLEGTPITVTATSNQQYVLSLKNNETEISSGTIVTINDTTTISTVAVPKTYNIEYILGEGGTSTNQTTFQYGTEITIQAPTRPGYQFDGWTSSAEDGLADTAYYYSDKWTGTKTGLGANKFRNLTDINGGTVKLTAQWVGNNYTVTLNPDGGSVSPTSIEVTYGNSYGQLPTPTKTGSTFLGWYYKNTKIESSTIVDKADNHTLVAEWGQGSRVLTYDYGTNGGQVSITDTRTTITEDKNFNDNIDLTRTAYKLHNAFLGWAETSDATEALAQTTELKMPDEDKTLYAIFANMNVSEEDIEININDTENKTKTVTVGGSNYGTASVVTSNSSIATATISENTITITAKAAGTTTITVTSSARDINDEALTKTIAVTVVKAPTGISLSKETVILGLNEGYATTQLTTTLSPTGTNAYNNVQWSSSDGNVVTVDESGNITAVAGGTATVTASTGKNNEITATATVIVDVTPPTITITRTKYNSFTWTAEDENEMGAYKNTNTPDTPTSGWTNTNANPKTVTKTVKNAETNYIWARDKVGNISNASITSYSLTRSVGSHTSLSVVTDATDDTNKYNFTGSSLKVLEGTPVTVTASADVGYAVTLMNNEEEITPETIITINSDIALTTTATASTYNIEYETNGGTLGNNSPTTGTYGTHYNIPSPTRIGYTFLGWTSSSEDGLGPNAKNNTYTVWDGSLATGKFGNLTDVNNETVKLTANWQAISYTIQYEMNGGTLGEYAPENATYDVPIRISHPTRLGYQFAGWTPRGGDSSYAISAYAQTGATEDSLDIWDRAATTNEYFMNLRDKSTMYGQIYANWTDNTYNIEYELNGGTAGSNMPTTALYSKRISISTPTKEGYRFTGWTSSVEDGLGTEAAYGSGSTPWDGSSITDTYFRRLTPESNGKVKLTANWEPVTYTIIYDLAADGELGEYAPSTAIYDTPVRISNPTRPGYTFAGWTKGNGIPYYIGSTAKTGTTENNLTPWDATATFNEYFMNLRTSGTVQLKAQWTVNTYNIQYELNGGTAGTYKPTSSKYTSEVRISNPTKEGYTFTGWTSSVEDGLGVNAIKDSNTAWDGSLVLAEYFKRLNTENNGTVKLTAHWESNIRATLNAGTEVTPVTIPIEMGVAYGELPTPEFGNREFEGWYLNLAKVGNFVDNLEVDANTGELIINSTQYCSTDAKIPVTGGITVYSNLRINGVYAYDENGQFIQRILKNSYELTIPEKAKYIRIEMDKNYLSKTCEQITNDLVISSYEQAENISYVHVPITAETINEVPGEHILFAKYDALIDFTVEFETVGGILNTTEKTVEYGKAYGELPTPTREGYTFAGWYPNLVQSATLLDNYEINEDSHEPQPRSNYIVSSELIPVKADTTYYTSFKIRGIYAYDADGSYVERILERKTDATTTDATKFVRLEINKTGDGVSGDLDFFKNNLIITDKNYANDISYINSEVTEDTICEFKQGHTLYAKWIPNP